MHTDKPEDGSLYIGALLFSLIVNMFNGFAEMSIAIGRLPVFYKQRDLHFYPAWIFTLPNFLLRIPMSIIESIAWLVVTYYAIGFAPDASRWDIVVFSLVMLRISCILFLIIIFVKQILQAVAISFFDTTDGRRAI